MWASLLILKSYGAGAGPTDEQEAHPVAAKRDSPVTMPR